MRKIKDQRSAHVGLIVPLTGPHAAIGQRMKDAARLALPEGQKPVMDVFDSAAPEGAAYAARQALAAGDKIILGPLLASDTDNVARVLQPAGVAELAFTSDVTQARPGVWVMGLTPEQQVRRLVEAARAEGRSRFAAFLPDTALGHSLAEGLTLTCQEAGLEVPQIVFHSRDVNDIAEKMAILSHLQERQGIQNKPVDEADPSATDPLAEQAPPPVSESKQELQPPPFDSLLLADTGLDLARVIDSLKVNRLLIPQVRILGPMLWRAFDSKLSDLQGAWYVAFDDTQRNGYVQSYQGVYGQMPSPVADFAYDSAALVGTLLRQKKLTFEGLIHSKGFIGVDGLFHLRADGRVTRALAVYQLVSGGGSRMVVQASRELSARVEKTTSPAVASQPTNAVNASGVTATGNTVQAVSAVGTGGTQVPPAGANGASVPATVNTGVGDASVPQNINPTVPNNTTSTVNPAMPSAEAGNATPNIPATSPAPQQQPVVTH